MTAAHVEVIDKLEGGCRTWEVTLLCWQCGASLTELTPDTRTGSGIRTCQRCKMTTQYRNGIWRALSPDRVDHFRKFIDEYELIRAAEGRGSAQPEYYLNLPFKDISGRNSDQWAIRARTFRAMQRSIVAPLARRTECALRILDLGAGNGWMSYRLALRGHLPIAVDLLTNDRDGLGAAVHYNTAIDPLFPRVQAELDRLPFAVIRLRPGHLQRVVSLLCELRANLCGSCAVHMPRRQRRDRRYAVVRRGRKRQKNGRGEARTLL